MKKFIAIVLSIFALYSCSLSKAKGPVTKGAKYAQLYQERPLSILIMPPINETNYVDAKEHFYTTLYHPLCEKGYYVFSPYLTADILKHEGAYDSEMFIDKDLSIFNRVFGADVVLFTRIKSWKKQSLGGYIKVDIDYILKSAKTNEIIYQRGGLIKLNTQTNVSGGGVLGSLLSVAATALTTALTDKVVVGRKCNKFVLSDLPVAKYHPRNMVDSLDVAGDAHIEATVR